MKWHDSLDMKYLGGEKFLSVNHFLGQTRVHIRRYIVDSDGELQPTKDGVSLTPKVWQSLCREIKTILKHKSAEKTTVIETDLCISKQVKDNVELYVFQRLFRKKNNSLQFVPEHVVLNLPELEKIVDHMGDITDRVKDGLITYSLSYYMYDELNNVNLQLNPLDNSDSFLELLDSLSKCLAEAMTIKITELINCFGCRESYQASFMHDCCTKSRTEKWLEYADLALYSINLRDVASDIIQKNLNIDFKYVLGQAEFFDSLIIPKIWESVQKIYVGEEQQEDENEFL